MADQTVAETAHQFGYDDAKEALRKTAQAVAILRSIWLAVEAQEGGSVTYIERGFSRWGPSVGAACDCVCAVRDLVINRVQTPDTVVWWTPLNLVEAIDAALWHEGQGSGKWRLSAEELQSVVDAAIDCLGVMFDALSVVADSLKPAPKPQHA